MTTDALLTAAWILPKEHWLGIIAVNVCDAPIAASIVLSAKDYGFSAGRLRATLLTVGGPAETFECSSAFRRDVSLPPRHAQVWEVRE